MEDNLDSSLLELEVGQNGLLLVDALPATSCMTYLWEQTRTRVLEKPSWSFIRSDADGSHCFTTLAQPYWVCLTMELELGVDDTVVDLINMKEK
jgi:hypothetical protein